MLMEETATTMQLEWAVEDKRDADAALAEARLQLVIAQSELDAVVAEHNALYRERLAAQAAARFERDTEAKDADWAETASRLDSLAEWLEEESRRCDLRYYRANDEVYDAERQVKDARETARARGRQLHEMLEKFRAGLVIDEGLAEPVPYDDYDGGSYDDCDCPMCRPYLYDDYYDWFDEDAYEEEERLTLETERTKRLTQKRKSYNLRRLRRRSRR